MLTPLLSEIVQERRGIRVDLTPYYTVENYSIDCTKDQQLQTNSEPLETRVLPLGLMCSNSSQII